ncbi:hypothetical protein F1B19_21670 [Salmonella enterica]|nr:hypothetical protein [Salmonella enterica]
MGGTASASPIVLTKLKAASNSENIPKKYVSITLPVGKDIPIDLAREDTIPKELATEDTVVKTTKKLLTGKTESFLAIVLSLSFFKIINFIYPSP